jgi:sulfopropanediol 3-dehydrogenase
MEKKKMKNNLKSTVNEIIQDVKINKDISIVKYNILFDKNSNKKFRVTKKQIKEAYNKVDINTIKSIKYAIKNIKKFSIAQLKQLREFKLEMGYGIIGQKITPIEKMGCYVPGGRFPLISSALMSVIPAKVSSVKEIIVCSPNIKSEVIVASDMAGATKIYNIGGVQAIAGMAYGTTQIPKVDKIIGPGNKFVTEAKRQVFGDVGIDMIAGPSELLIIADNTADERLIQFDLNSQKEHDPDSKVILIKVDSNLKNSIANAIDKANLIAPEHLQLIVANPKKYMQKLRNFGTMFIGKNSSVVFGDYCSGTNHILPTNKASRYRAGLSVYDFVKIQSYQEINEKSKGYDELIDSTITLAETEGLIKHKEAAESRRRRK